MKHENKIFELEGRLRFLNSRQQQFNEELNQVQKELLRLKEAMGESLVAEALPTAINYVEEPVVKPVAIAVNKSSEPVKEPAIKKSFSRPQNQKLEDFIGTNITSKIGIIITIIGIFIGSKYAIDKELISPVMRIVLGYLAGAGLIFTATRLKQKYLNFSAVLMGGGLAVIYFITYIAYSFYQLFPQTAAFGLMVAITIAAVAIALWYNQKIIAILGQVAAYAIPFLLSDGSGKIIILFTYISMINIGLIYLSFKKDWKILYRIAFFLTWLISVTWIITGEEETKKLTTGMVFLSVNFITFYITFLAYKIVKKELYNITEVALVLFNALLFFFLGNSLLNGNYQNDDLLTAFTLINAAIHFVTGFIVYRLKLADDTVHQFLIGLGLLFITIAIPIELDGSWVTLLWAIEAAILCWIGVRNNRPLYLRITSAMVVIASISLVQDWMAAYPVFGTLIYNVSNARQLFFNATFLSSVIVSICFGFIHFNTYKKDIRTRINSRFFRQAMPLIFWSALFFTLFNEIHYLWDLKIDKTLTLMDQPAFFYQKITLLIFTLIFFAGLLELNKRIFKNRSVDERLLLGGIFICILFVSIGLLYIGGLRDIYISQPKVSNPSEWMLFIRYISFAALAIFYLEEWQAVKRIGTINSKKIFSIAFNITLLIIICNEFIHWMDLAGYQNQYKLGLSIICGLYALVMIVAGIIKQQQYLRVFAIVLFAATLLKLFFYDLSSLTTISKTIVLIILGILLLIVSFLYNKYKHVILNNQENLNVNN